MLSLLKIGDLPHCEMASQKGRKAKNEVITNAFKRTIFEYISLALHNFRELFANYFKNTPVLWKRNLNTFFPLWTEAYLIWIWVTLVLHHFETSDSGLSFESEQTSHPKSKSIRSVKQKWVIESNYFSRHLLYCLNKYKNEDLV